MTFLMPNLLCGAQTNSGARGTPPTETHPPEICTAGEGIKVTRVHPGFPRVGASGGGTHLGIPYPLMAESRTGGSGHLDGRRRRRGEILGPDPGAPLASRGPDDGVHRHSAPRHQACQRWQPVNGAGSRSRVRGMNKGGVDSKAVFLRLSQAAVHSRAADSGCSIQADFQDGRIRPWDDSRSPPRCSSRSAFGLCLGRSG